jgi:ribosomal protein S18 acetylase RimI-like enzyme
MLHAIDMTLLPPYRSRGVGRRLVAALLAEARELGQLVSARVPRRNERASAFYAALGFRLVAMDDLDHYYEWRP